MKKIILAGAAIGVVAVIAAVKLFGGKEAAVVDTLPVVETVKPQTGTIELYTSLIGRVEPETVARIYPEAGGTIQELFVKTGDTVTVGQPLCTIDTKQVETAKNTMDNAEVSNKEAQDMLGRMTPIYGSGGISQAEYQGYVNAAEKTEITYKQAVEEYERQFSYSHVTSPINGRVETCGVEMYDRVTSADQLYVLTGEGNKVISSSLTENLRSQVNLGDTIFAEKGEIVYIGTITEMSEMANEHTGLYDSKIRLNNAEGLATGTVVKISICSNRAEQVLTVPVDSVYYENSRPYVYTYEDGIIHKVFIKMGLFDSERMEVAYGLNKNNEVVATWNPELHEGAEVTKAAPAVKTDSGASDAGTEAAPAESTGEKGDA